jgi:hypothetical protein
MTEIVLRADSHYGTPEVLDLCDSLGLRYVFSLSKNARLPFFGTATARVYVDKDRKADRISGRRLRTNS